MEYNFHTSKRKHIIISSKLGYASIIHIDSERFKESSEENLLCLMFYSIEKTVYCNKIEI